MAKLNRKQIQDHARRLLSEAPGGRRWGEMLNIIHARDPETPLDYTTIVLPQLASPDMFYTNTMLRRLLEANQSLFNKLF